MTIAKVQHYVPQFLLRNFGGGKKKQIWVYDKSKDRIFSTNAKNIASESRFYDFEVGEKKLTLEPSLSRIESQAKTIFESILSADSIAVLTKENRTILSGFFAIQFTRTKAFRQQWSEFPGMLREALQKRGDTVAQGSQADEIMRDLTENETKEQTSRIVIKAPKDFGPHFAAKDWLLAATTRKHPFILSDNPITLQNMIDIPLRGNLGLNVTGIEIYFPLSPTRALAMWCPTLMEAVRQSAKALSQSPRLGEKLQPENREQIFELDEALKTGRPLEYKKLNVENFNSLQIARSERYVFSSINDFDLAKDMIESHPELRQGPRMQIVT